MNIKNKIPKVNTMKKIIITIAMFFILLAPSSISPSSMLAKVSQGAIRTVHSGAIGATIGFYLPIALSLKPVVKEYYESWKKSIRFDQSAWDQTTETVLFSAVPLACIGAVVGSSIGLASLLVI